ncbi:unnamed protein product [Mytilus coruscus]|uniref:OTU domain-containing protein n=1 Tax=Mytilus coruscus TaxID=42192 RepID=A0A6J8AM36_MYTCO|nr:unnamed protein product [Mytilus coruscus]
MKQVGVNWVRQLQKYERKINDGPKECLAWKCPFEIYYGRTRQSHLRKSFKSPQVWEDHVKHNRNLAQKATRHCNDRKNKAWMKKSTVIKVEKRNHKYQVSFVPPYSKCNKKQWFYVSDITGSSLSGGKNSSNPEQRQKKHSNYKSPYYMILTPKDKTYNLISDFRLTVAFNPLGDGNCQFAAISHQLQRLGIYRSAETLRREVITYLGQTSRLGSADNRVLWSNMIIESRSDYLLRMARDTEFGDQITLQAMSDMFNVQIVIVSTLNHGTTLLRPDGSNIITRHLPFITIGHYPEGHGEHYLSLTYNHNAVRRIAEDSSQIHWGYDDTDDEHDDRSDEHDDTGSGHDDTDDKHHDTDDGHKDTDDTDTDDKYDDTDDEHNIKWYENYDTCDEHIITVDEHDITGNEHNITGDVHDITGDEHNITGEEHNITGDEHNITGDEHDMTGDEHTITGDVHDITGDEHDITGDENDITGDEHNITGDEHDITGDEHDITGDEHDITGDEHDITCDEHNITGDEHDLTGDEHDITGDEHNITGDEHDMTDDEHDITGYEHDITGDEHNITGDEHNITGDEHDITGDVHHDTGVIYNENHDTESLISLRHQVEVSVLQEPGV